ncbi:hypothetical protein DFH08DRAFT_723937 [Mycena albidolilacea]|uniref:Uncharacterized protein n=1 Tax=Mycena albidolilacea TaxID=1033008 RepID=A0AAD6YZJ2_9AGAR|nr:hypothetical protein DFH08DRAFT_723937 [Mycena albidolilacea]
MPISTIQDAAEKSRMRAHGGNVPSLPQTKCCSLCPAKFTRTTHLNRHLRSHTNERLHRCNLCKSSEFTRSDLLTRHKRTCGQSVNRSRRKSCEACAESKIKCNLQFPCAKCTSRGRECVFQNDPEESRRKCSKRKSKSRSVSESPPLSPSPELPSSSSSPPPEDYSRTPSRSPSSSDINALPDLSLSESGASSEDSSIQSSPRSENFQTFDEQPFSYSFDAVVGGYDPDPLLSPFDPCLFPSTNTSTSGLGLDAALNGDPNTFPHLAVDQGMDLFTSLIRSLPLHPPPPSMLESGHAGRSDLIASLARPLRRTCTVRSSFIVSVNSLAHLLIHFHHTTCSTIVITVHLFFTRFLAQVPLIHAPTWKMADTLPILTRVFYACGALFVKTPEAAAFVESTLAAVTAEIGDEFDRPNADVHLIIGLVLLQMIQVFRSQEGGGATNSTQTQTQHHAMLVTMIRRTNLIHRVASWSAPDCTDPMALDEAWVEWAEFATIKRALLLAYVQSTYLASASPPPTGISISHPELANVPLPCDDALWCAPSAAAWFAAAHTPGLGGLRTRICGVRMRDAIEVLAGPPGTLAYPNVDNADTLPIPSSGLFILIHTILQDISSSNSIALLQRAPPGGWSCFAQPTRPQLSASGEWTLFRAQAALDNWLQMWLRSPEATPTPSLDSYLHVNGAGGEIQKHPHPPFVCNSLPLYWLAQVAIWENSWSGPAFIDIPGYPSFHGRPDYPHPHPLATR